MVNPAANENASKFRDPVIWEPSSAREPPLKETGPVKWVRANLFDGWFNSIITLFILWALISAVPKVWDWGASHSYWGDDQVTVADSYNLCRVEESAPCLLMTQGANPVPAAELGEVCPVEGTQSCLSATSRLRAKQTPLDDQDWATICRQDTVGACWAVLHEKYRFILFGLYPNDQHWRPLFAMIVLVGGVVASAALVRNRRAIIWGWLAGILAIFLLMGGGFPYQDLFPRMAQVEADQRVTVADDAMIEQALQADIANWNSDRNAAVKAAREAGFALVPLCADSPDAADCVAPPTEIGSFSQSWIRNISAPLAGFWYKLDAWRSAASLPYVPLSNWGGLPLTLGLSVVGLFFAFPLGILLALGRRSSMPFVKSLSIFYIELIRGVPLVTLLFMASFLLPLFMPSGFNVPALLRAQVAFIMFAAAYLAEVVRGGLQAVPKGQYEAADAMGLSYWQKVRLIILPQALKIAIPPIVNTFIGFFKDTSLVVVISLYDLLGTAKAAINSSPIWRDFYFEVYFFLAIIYFVFCFSMSVYSRHLERKLNTGHAR